MRTFKMIPKIFIGFLIVSLIGYSVFEMQSLKMSEHVEAADSQEYLSVKLSSFGIPNAVLQVLLDNSISSSNGKSLSSNGVTVASATISDIKSASLISIATRSLDSEGAVSSTPAAAVANWVYSLKSSDMNLSQYVSTSTSAETILTKGVPKWQGATDYTNPPPVLNAFMAILNSATNAETIDLTGLTNRIKDSSGTQLGILSLFQTNQLTKLKELYLGENHIGALGSNLSGSQYYYQFRSTTLTSNSLKTLSLVGNDFTYLDDNLLYGIGKQIANICLSNNDIQTIAYNNGELFISAANNSASSSGSGVDLSGNNNLSLSNSNTSYILTSVINTGGGINLSDALVNGLVSTQINGWPGISSSGLMNVSDQLTSSTVDTIVNQKSGLITSDVLESLAMATDPPISSESLLKLVQSNPDIVSKTVIDNLAVKDTEALSSDVLLVVLKQNPELVDSKVLENLVQNNAEALTTEVLDYLVENNPAVFTDISSESVEILQHVATTTNDTPLAEILGDTKTTTPAQPKSALNVEGEINIEGMTIGETSVTTDTRVCVEATLLPGQSLGAIPSRWENQRGVSFCPTMNFSGDTSFILNNQKKILVSNVGLTAETINQTFSKLTYTLPKNLDLRDGDVFKGEIKWVLLDGVSESQN